MWTTAVLHSALDHHRSAFPPHTPSLKYSTLAKGLRYDTRAERDVETILGHSTLAAHARSGFGHRPWIDINARSADTNEFRLLFSSPHHQVVETSVARGG